MSRYRKVDPRIWNDAKFCALDDKGKLVFFMLLTHPNMTAVGAMRHTLAGMAEELGWAAEAFREAFGQVKSRGMVEHDPKACFIGLPKFLEYNRPESPNVVRAWRGSFDLLPECEHKTRLLSRCQAFAQGVGDAFGEAFRRVMAQEIVKTSPNQEQEQEQEQSLNTDASAPDGAGGKPPSDVAELWSAGRSLLESQGVPAKQTGAFIGGLISKHGEPAVLAAVRAAVVKQPAGARAWLIAAAEANGKGAPRTGKHSGFENKEYGKGFEE